MQGREDDLRGVALLRDQQLALLVPFHVLGGLFFHRCLVLFLAEGNRHETVVGLCTPREFYDLVHGCCFARRRTGTVQVTPCEVERLTRRE